MAFRRELPVHGICHQWTEGVLSWARQNCSKCRRWFRKLISVAARISSLVSWGASSSINGKFHGQTTNRWFSLDKKKLQMDNCPCHVWLLEGSCLLCDAALAFSHPSYVQWSQKSLPEKIMGRPLLFRQNKNYPIPCGWKVLLDFGALIMPPTLLDFDPETWNDVDACAGEKTQEF